MHHFTHNMEIPFIFALLAILAESFGALGLIAGLATRIAALGVGATFGVAALFHVQHGFFMNWFGKQAGEGIEYHLLVVGMALALVVSGGGRWSLDARLAKGKHG
jgi:putative oxidoreductase